MARTGIALLLVAAAAAVAWALAGPAPDAPPGLVHWLDAGQGVEPLAATAALVERGRGIYAVRCQTCHGQDGKGDGPAARYLGTPPRDLTSGTYKFRTTGQEGMPEDLDLFRSISAGFPIYGMPSFRWLPAEDRWALVHYVKAFYPKWSRVGTAPRIAVDAAPPAGEGAVERGRALYLERFDCKQCHGEGGHGDGPRVPDLKDGWGRPILPRDFTLGPVFRKAGWRTADTVRVIATGIPGTPMPSHLDQIADPADLTEFWDVARYVDYLIQQAREEER